MSINEVCRLNRILMYRTEKTRFVHGRVFVEQLVQEAEARARAERSAEVESLRSQLVQMIKSTIPPERMSA